MNKHVQVREIPAPIHQALKDRAAAEGLSMSDFIRRLIDRELARPAWADIEARLAEAPEIGSPLSSAELVRSVRDAARDLE